MFLILQSPCFDTILCFSHEQTVTL